MLGAATGIAGALFVAAIVASGDPLGRLIGALLAAGIVAGLVGTLLRRSAIPYGSIRRDPGSHSMPELDPEGPAALATPARIDATAWMLDDNAPDFAPVISLTEAKIARREVERAPRVAVEA
jgi:hypothetical protein